MHVAPGQRCWQVMALSRADRYDGPRVDIQQCHECSVYRSSCPDRLTELGESFNNLMFLLEEEAAQVGQMRAQMVEKEKMVALGQLAAGVAHEVGNPLSSISSIVQMLRRGHGREPKPEELDLIETHIQRISSIVRQLAGQARPGTERWESLDVGSVIDAAVRLVRFDRRARDVEIVCRSPETPQPTIVLRNQLQQVFLNLALNALDAMPQGGKLTIETKEDPRHIVVTVADTGCGIQPEIGRRIFEPFYTTKEPGQGTGLGLSVSYTIIEAHGGTIDFDSVVGQGTEFTVKLPIRNEPSKA
jgi:signal transduction histidine kinase